MTNWWEAPEWEGKRAMVFPKAKDGPIRRVPDPAEPELRPDGRHSNAQRPRVRIFTRCRLIWL